MIAPRAWRIPSAVLLIGLAGCGGSVDHETLGDRAYTAGRYPDAVVEYRLALKQRAPNPRLRAKAGAAALHAGDRVVAAEEYLQLAAEASDRRTEAADGLERVARDALARNDQAALAAALAGLGRVARGRALGAFASQLARGVADAPNAQGAIAILPYAAAAAPDARSQDSLIFAYGRALARAGRCEDASGSFESLIRRQRDSALVAGAERQLSVCALTLARAALQAGRHTVAEDWFRRAAIEGSDDENARAAYLGLGDIMATRGDYGGAADAYRRAMSTGAADDPTATLARQRLNALGNAGTVIQ